MKAWIIFGVTVVGWLTLWWVSVQILKKSFEKIAQANREVQKQIEEELKRNGMRLSKTEEDKRARL